MVFTSQIVRIVFRVLYYFYYEYSFNDRLTMNTGQKVKNNNWTFLTNHTHVLLCLVKSSSMRIRDIAEAVGITERSVQHILFDLDNEGFIDRVKDGRCNAYKLHLDKHLRHPIEKHRKISGLASFVLGVQESRQGQSEGKQGKVSDD